MTIGVELVLLLITVPSPDKLSTKKLWREPVWWPPVPGWLFALSVSFFPESSTSNLWWEPTSRWPFPQRDMVVLGENVVELLLSSPSISFSCPMMKLEVMEAIGVELARLVVNGLPLLIVQVAGLGIHVEAGVEDAGVELLLRLVAVIFMVVVSVEVLVTDKCHAEGRVNAVIGEAGEARGVVFAEWESHLAVCINAAPRPRRRRCNIQATKAVDAHRDGQAVADFVD